MSLIRTALRLQAIETLNSDPVILAMVQGRVFDSRISALDHREPVPVILVTTEETKGEAWSAQNGGLPFKTSCDLILEIGMNALAEALDEQGKIVLDSDGAPVQLIARATTDRELEAQLDLIEERAIAILTVGETPAAELLRSAIVRRVPRIASSRFATDQTGEKLAIHLLTLSVDFLNPEDDEPLDPPTGAYAALPEPLRTIAAASSPGGSVRATCDQLAGLLTPPAPVDPPPEFTGLDLVVAPQPLHPASAPDRADDLAAGRTFAAPATIL